MKIIPNYNNSNNSNVDNQNNSDRNIRRETNLRIVVDMMTNILKSDSIPALVFIAVIFMITICGNIKSGNNCFEGKYQ